MKKSENNLFIKLLLLVTYIYLTNTKIKPGNA